jgi:hypothetical protein
MGTRTSQVLNSSNNSNGRGFCDNELQFDLAERAPPVDKTILYLQPNGEGTYGAGVMIGHLAFSTRRSFTAGGQRRYIDTVYKDNNRMRWHCTSLMHGSRRVWSASRGVVVPL